MSDYIPMTEEELFDRWNKLANGEIYLIGHFVNGELESMEHGYDVEKAKERRNELFDENGKLKNNAYYESIYAIKAIVPNEEAVLIKIGKSDNPKNRVKLLQVGNPYELELLASKKFHDVNKSEENLHKMFANQRIRGEWFRLSDDELRQLLLILGQKNEGNE